MKSQTIMAAPPRPTDYTKKVALVLQGDGAADNGNLIETTFALQFIGARLLNRRRRVNGRSR